MTIAHQVFFFFFLDTLLLIKVNELLQMHHPNKLDMGFKDSNNAVLEKSLNGFNDYKVCVILGYIDPDTKI